MNIPYCNNCGCEGHLYRNCKYPVMSYGIIIFNKDNKILMIQRKNSIAYIEFLRGKYKLENTDYILKLFNCFSVDERKSITDFPFDTLWNNLWTKVGKVQTDRMIKEYTISKKKFNSFSCKDIVDKCNKSYNTPEWEFPKGRRSNRESNIKCAIREFEEETDLNSDEYILLENIIPSSEEYTGSNGVRYKHIYYYAIYKGSRELTINMDKYEQYSEIGDIQWLTVDECYHKIREENPTKNNIIHNIDEFMKNWNKDFILKK